jgi:hypothetical protein
VHFWARGPGFVELFGFFVNHVVVKGDEAGGCGADANCEWVSYEMVARRLKEMDILGMSVREVCSTVKP